MPFQLALLSILVSSLSQKPDKAPFLYDFNIQARSIHIIQMGVYSQDACGGAY